MSRLCARLYFTAARNRPSSGVWCDRCSGSRIWRCRVALVFSSCFRFSSDFERRKAASTTLFRVFHLTNPLPFSSVPTPAFFLPIASVSTLGLRDPTLTGLNHSTHWTNWVGRSQDDRNSRITCPSSRSIVHTLTHLCHIHYSTFFFIKLIINML